jgi:SnoaL-like protein
MPSPAEIAARTYVAAWQEPDAVIRARLLDGCFAADGRIVSPGAVIRGRAALAAAIDDFFADPRGLSGRLVSTIDAQGPIFRFRSLVEDRDGRIVFDGFDAGEVDVDGRITVLLTFGGASPDSMRAAGA